MKFFKKEYKYKSTAISTVTQVEDYVKSKTKIKFEISKSELCKGTGPFLSALDKVILN